MTDKLHMIEGTLQRLTDVVVSLQEGFNSNLIPHLNLPRPARDEIVIDDVERTPFFHKSLKLELLTFYKGDSIELLSRVGQYFNF